MRRFTLTLCVLAFAGLAIVAEAIAENNQAFPYTTYVLENGSYVRSGPGKAYYPTERLKAGDAVEVYRHDPGGWLAIRPTSNSFTWVRSRYLRSLGDGLAEVTGSKVAARMGSHLKNTKDVVQVRLHKGETVELLDTKSLDGTEPGAWIKIRPPSGEFRWIHSSLVHRQSNESGLRRPHRSIPRTPTRSEQPTPSTPRPTTVSQYDKRPMHFAHDQRPQPTYPAPSRGNTPRENGPLGNGWDFEEAIAELELELSKMVASEPTSWSFDQIASDAEALAPYSQTALERGRIQEMLNKINRFEELQTRKTRFDQMIAQQERRHQQLAAQRNNLYRTANAGQPNTQRPGAPLLAMLSGDKRFDGTGVLKRVKPIQKGAPNYALIDNTGKIRCYVTPGPDVSLKYYENRRVGVSGSRGLIRSNNARHVMVQRVQLLR
ncbi:MAG: hypothetical protein PVH19_12345 [Planctomycetia bacterium]|jgi:uncharacterized protein YgiM (DUF1202 family)